VTKVIVNYSLGLRRFGGNGTFARLIYTMRRHVITIAFFVALSGSFAFAQDRALTLNQVSDLLKQGISSSRIAQLVEQYGVGFELNEAAARRLRQDGADEVVLSAVKRMSARYAEEQRRKRSEAEDAKRREQQEEAQRRAERKRQEEARQEQAKQKEVEKRGTKKPEETASSVEDVRKRLEEARRREEQKRQSTAVDKATPEAPRVILPFDKTPGGQEEPKQRPQKGPGPALRTPEEADRVASLRNVTSTPEGEVSGEIVNNSTHTVRDVQLQILYSWRWKNETRPGKDDPGAVNYHSLNQEIPAGKTTRFNYKPSPPLPSRTDGQFDVTVKIIGFAEIIPGVRK
jgi:hypothetical protein